MAIKHTNKLGKTRWQPQISDGRAMYYGFYQSKDWIHPNARIDPVRYRYRWFAEIVEGMKEHRIARNSWTQEGG